MSLRPRDAGLAALIFDFDGVIADSEALANLVLAEAVSRLGKPTTLDEALARYSGRRWVEAMGEIERHIGRPLPGQAQTHGSATPEQATRPPGFHNRPRSAGRFWPRPDSALIEF